MCVYCTFKALCFNGDDIPFEWDISGNRNEYLTDNQRLGNLNKLEIIVVSPAFGV